MSNPQTIEKNIKIALFDGAEVVTFDCSTYYKKGGVYYEKDLFKYHESWQHLMPVLVKVETIENGRFGFSVDPWEIEIIDYANNETQILCISRDNDNGRRNLLNDFYEAIYLFIEWYNKNKGVENPVIEHKLETIAIYDGWEYVTGGSNSKLYKKDGYSLPSTKFDYNTNWQSLMPVIEKISKIRLEENGKPCIHNQDTCYPRTFGMPSEDGKRVLFRFNGYACHEGETLIEAAFEAVYEFIYSDNIRKQNQQ